MTWQWLFAGACVLAAWVYTLYRVWQRLQRVMQPGASACTGCSAGSSCGGSSGPAACTGSNPALPQTANRRVIWLRGPDQPK